VTTVVRHTPLAAADVLSPILATVTPILGTHRQPGLQSGLVVRDENGWLRATQLVDGTRLHDLLDSVQRRRHASPHAAAALAWKSYTYWLALPATLGWASARRVPLLCPADVLVRFEDDRSTMTLGLGRSIRVAVLPSSPLATSGLPQVRVVPDESAMLVTLRESLVDGHLVPLLGAIQARVRVGARTLLGSVSSGIAHGILDAAGALNGSGAEHIATLLEALGLEGLVELVPDQTGQLTVRRKTCCLAFTLPQPKICAGCCITPERAVRRGVRRLGNPRVGESSADRTFPSGGG
jgi:hypothetical protein